MNIEILPPGGEIKYFGEIITFKNVVQVEFEHRIKCASATFTSHRQELKSPKYPLRDILKLFDATVTPSLLHASRTRTMTEEMKKKLQTMQRRIMMKKLMQTMRKTSGGHATAHAASVEDTSDVETHDPDSEPVEHNNQDLNKHDESSHDADSNPFINEISEDNRTTS